MRSFRRCHPLRNVILSPIIIDHLQNRVAAQRPFPDLLDRLTGQRVESIMNCDLETHNVGFLLVPTPGSKSPTSARTSWPSSAAACPRTGPSDTTRPPCSSRPSSRSRATPAPSTGPPVGWVHVGTTQGRGRYDRYNPARQAQEGRLAAASAKRLATNPQSLKSPGRRTVTTR